MYGAVIYGYIASVVQRWGAVLMCAFQLIAAGSARVFVGAHFVTDIFGA